MSIGGGRDIQAYTPGDPRGAPTPQQRADYQNFLNSPAAGIPPGVAPGEPAGGWAAQNAWLHRPQSMAALGPQEYRGATAGGGGGGGGPQATAPFVVSSPAEIAAGVQARYNDLMTRGMASFGAGPGASPAAVPLGAGITNPPAVPLGAGITNPSVAAGWRETMHGSAPPPARQPFEMATSPGTAQQPAANPIQSAMQQYQTNWQAPVSQGRRRAQPWSFGS